MRLGLQPNAPTPGGVAAPYLRGIARVNVMKFIPIDVFENAQKLLDAASGEPISSFEITESDFDVGSHSGISAVGLAIYADITGAKLSQLDEEWGSLEDPADVFSDAAAVDWAHGFATSIEYRTIRSIFSEIEALDIDAEAKEKVINAIDRIS